MQQIRRASGTRKTTKSIKDVSPPPQQTSAEATDTQLWLHAEVLFLVETKKSFEADKKNRLKTKRDEWKTLVAAINVEFGSHLNAKQVENK